MLDYTLSKDLPDNHCWGSTKKCDAFKIYIFYPKLFFFQLLCSPFSSSNLKTPMPSYSFFSSLNLLSNSMFSQGQTAAFTFYGNCKYETHDDEFFVKTGSRKRLRFLNA